jgi:hypothetical protein
VEPTLLRTTGHSLPGRLFLTLWGGLATVDVARPTGSSLLTGALVIVLAGCCAIGQSVPAAAAIATTGWLVLVGFVQHRYGELGFTSSSWGLLAAVLAVVLTVAVRTEAGRR